MIRESQRLPDGVLAQIPGVVEEISADSHVEALFIFGSGAGGALKPLSDLDFAVLLSERLDKRQRFEKHLALIGIFTGTFKTEEIDLVVMNDAPIRFSYNIVKEGKLLYCSQRTELVDFVERTIKLYLDFRFFRDAFDQAYLKGAGYRG